MTTPLDLPSSIIPASCELGLQRQVVQHRSSITGTFQAIEVGSEFWTMNLNLPARLKSQAGGDEAFFNRLVGGAQPVKLWHFGREVPRGTLRGSPKLANTAAQFSRTLSLYRCTGKNLLLNGSFSGVDGTPGTAANWNTYLAGSFGTPSFSVAAVYGGIGPTAQAIAATSLGTSITDRVGVATFSSVDVTSIAGAPFTYSMYTATPIDGIKFRLYIDWYEAGPVYMTSDSLISTLNGGVWGRAVMSSVAPPGAVIANVYAWMEQMPGSPGPASIYLDGAQLEAGPVATDFEGTATVKAGDMLGVGGQLFQVAADTTSTDTGLMTISTVNRVRSAIAADTPVTWYRPTANFVMAESASAFMHGPAGMAPTAFSFVEAV